MSGRPTCEAVEQLGGRVGHLLPVEDAQPGGQPARPGQLAAGVEVRGRIEVVEQRQVLVDGLDAAARAHRRASDRHRPAVHLDGAVIQAVHAADALDERGLAGAVVAEDGEHLAAVDLEVDAVEREHRAEALRRPADREGRDGRGGGHDRAASADPEAALEVAAQDVRLDREHDDDADDDELEERVDVSRFIPFRITPIISAPTRALMTVPRPPRKLAPPMTTAAMESSSASSPNGGRAGIEPAGRDDPGDAGHQPAQDVHRDQDPVDRDARPPGAPRGSRRRRRSSGPRRCGSSG